MENLIVEKVNDKAIIPNKAHKEDAGFDLYSVEDYVLQPGEYKSIDTGIRIQLPRNTEAQIRPKSGIANNFGVTVLNTPGTVDEGYTGNIQVILINLSKKPFEIKVGNKIAQMVIAPVYQVAIKEGGIDTNTDRGDGKFGSTGLGDNRIREVKTYTERRIFIADREIFFRNSPNISCVSEIVGSYKRGEYVLYNQLINDGEYEWISWISDTEDIRRYMPIKNLLTNESYGVIREV